MNIVRNNDPFAGLTGLHKQMDDMFSAMLGGNQVMTTAGSMDLYEEDGALHADVLVPGFTKDEVSVSVHDGILEIKGDKTAKEEKEDKKRVYMLQEMSTSFYRRIALPKQGDTDKIDAHYDNGTLHVTIPYKELPKPKQVPIHTKK